MNLAHLKKLLEALEFDPSGSPDTGWFKWKTLRRSGAKAGDWAGSINQEGYRIIGRGGLREHHLVYLLTHGELPELLDHIDRNRLNNAPENLRVIDRRSNALNSKVRRNNKSGYRGVSQRADSMGWIVQIKSKYGNKLTARTRNIEDAATIYNFWAAEHHGEHANYNTVNQPWLETKLHELDKGNV